MKIPGFIDLQVNGYKGVDFSNPNLTIDDVEFVCRELFSTGTVAYCPTLISSSLGVYERNLKVISKASQSDKGATILGIHLEGPFISSEEGYRGVHSINNIVEPSIQIYEKFKSWSKNSIALITLDPSKTGSLELIEYITSRDKSIISIGHSNADNETIKEAINKGVRCATHIGNGIFPMIHRHQNPL